MSSAPIRIRGKRKNRSALKTAIIEARKMAKFEQGQSSEVQDALFAKFEALPAEILEEIFMFSRSLALLGVSRRLRAVLNRDYILERVMMAPFYDIGWFYRTDTAPHALGIDPTCIIRDEFVPQWKTILAHPSFRFSWFEQHVRKWQITTAKRVMEEWKERANPEDDGDSLSRLFAHLDHDLPASLLNKPANESFTDFGIGIYRGNVWTSKEKFDCEVDTVTMEEMREDDSQFIFLTFDVGGMQTPQPGVVDITSDDAHSVCITPVREIYNNPWAEVVHVMPKAYCRAPFTQAKGNMMKCILDFCLGMDRYTIRDHGKYPILDDLSNGLEEALTVGCIPAIFCMGIQAFVCESDFTVLQWDWRPDWSKILFSSEPLVLQSYSDLDSPDPWLYLNGNCALRFDGEGLSISTRLDYPRPRVEERHLLACLKNLDASPELYTFFLNNMLADFAIIPTQERFALSSDFLNALYLSARGQSGQVKTALTSIYERCNEKVEYWSKRPKVVGV